MTYLFNALTSTWLMITNPDNRDERGGNGGGIESLLLIAGAIIIAGLVVAGVTAYVRSHMPG